MGKVIVRIKLTNYSDQVPLEGLDFVVDAKGQKLGPGSPRGCTCRGRAG